MDQLREPYSTFAFSFGSKRGSPNPSLAGTGASLTAPPLLIVFCSSSGLEGAVVEVLGKNRNRGNEQQAILVIHS